MKPSKLRAAHPTETDGGPRERLGRRLADKHSRNPSSAASERRQRAFAAADHLNTRLRLKGLQRVRWAAGDAVAGRPR
jgi:hypothetical protein